MKEYKNPEMEILNLTANDVLNGSGEPPVVDSSEMPDVTPSISIF